MIDQNCTSDIFLHEDAHLSELGKPLDSET